MKKILCFLLAVNMVFSIPCIAFAGEATPEGEVIGTFIGEDGYEYEYIQYSNPVTYTYDGTTHTLLATVRRKPSDNANLTRDYYEYTTWSVIDNGIVQSWVFMSNPYFVKSIARGEVYEESVDKDVSIAAKAGVNIPIGSQSIVNETLEGEFSLGLTGKYYKTITIRLSGPTDAAYNTRTFYYKLGYHKHNITIIEKLYSNWDGLLKETEHTNCYGYEPAVQSYSEDSNV